LDDIEWFVKKNLPISLPSISLDHDFFSLCIDLVVLKQVGASNTQNAKLSIWQLQPNRLQEIHIGIDRILSRSMVLNKACSNG
jgi:hypothetical protein